MIDPLEVQQREVQNPAPGKGESLQPSGSGTKWLAGNLAKRELSVQCYKLNFSEQLSLWQRQPITSCTVLAKPYPGVLGNDYSHVFGICDAALKVLHPVLGSPLQERYRPPGASPAPIPKMFMGLEHMT